MTEYRYEMLPSHLREGMQKYLEHRVPTGSFLQSVLSNDLMQTVSKADEVSEHHLRDIVAFLFSEAPSDSYGSPAAYHGWINPFDR